MAKNALKPWRVKSGALPSPGEFVAKMEDVLDVYHCPWTRPRLLDESGKELQ